MDQFLAFSWQQLPLVILTLVVAFSVHEFAHAYVAYKFGDPTAKNQGRLTLSPLVHLDFIGTLMLIFLGFGWAKPVPVNRFNFKNPRLASILVSLAGPASNLVLGFVALIVWKLAIFLQIGTIVPESFVMTLFEFFNTFIYINIVLFIFNLLPIPPLDGYRILEEILPRKARVTLNQYEVYGSIIFLVLVLTPLNQYTIQPLFNTVIPFVFGIMRNLASAIFGF